MGWGLRGSLEARNPIPSIFRMTVNLFYLAEMLYYFVHRNIAGYDKPNMVSKPGAFFKKGKNVLIVQLPQKRRGIQ